MRVFPEGDKVKQQLHTKVAERLGYVTLVNCQLETGRTHPNTCSHETHWSHSI